jgi:Core-2/I-Branching enzyme
MKVAYLVLAHNNAHLLRRMAKTLSFNDCEIFVHIDKKVDIHEFSGLDGDDVHLSAVRVPVFWGDFSQVRAILVLLREALRRSQDYDYVVLLSGSDYPLRSGRYIHAFLSENKGTEFMSLIRIPNEEAGMSLAKINRLWIGSDKPILRFSTKVLAKMGLARRDYRKYLRGLEPYGGQTWWALTREACEYVLEFVERNQFVEKFFRTTATSDEMFFHTILGNSAFRSRMRRNLHFIDWPSGSSHPLMIGEHHAAVIDTGKKVYVNDIWGRGEVLFARKFSDENLDLIDRIDERIIRTEQR